MLQRLAAALLLRKLHQDLQRIGDALDAQTRALTRLASHFAPDPPPVNREQLTREGSVDYLDPIDAGLALDFIEKFHQDTGHTPDEEEILIYLADEKTTDLHRRLIERDEELQRLMEARR